MISLAPYPLVLSLSKDERCSWFDKLTMSGPEREAAM